MCKICGLPDFVSCSCPATNVCPPVVSYGCSSDGCIVKLDTKCVLYHKDNNDVSKLTNLEINNGTSLTVILELIDEYIGKIRANDWNFPVLEGDLGYDINTMQQFATAVDEQIGLLRTFRGNVNADPSDLNDGDYWWRLDLAAASALKIRVNGTTRTITTS